MGRAQGACSGGVHKKAKLLYTLQQGSFSVCSGPAAKFSGPAVSPSGLDSSVCCSLTCTPYSEGRLKSRQVTYTVPCPPDHGWGVVITKLSPCRLGTSWDHLAPELCPKAEQQVLPLVADLCPNPNIFSFRFFTPSTNAGMFSTFPIRSSMRSTASLAPPCRGPYRAPMAPAATN